VKLETEYCSSWEVQIFVNIDAEVHRRDEMELGQSFDDDNDGPIIDDVAEEMEVDEPTRKCHIYLHLSALCAILHLLFCSPFLLWISFSFPSVTWD
jgi:hypothetical protein